jgi:hypothetical protein
MTSEKNVYGYDIDGNRTTVDRVIGPVATPTRVISKKTVTYDLFNRMTYWKLGEPDGAGGWTVEKSEGNSYRGDKWQRSSTVSATGEVKYLHDGHNVIADIVNGVLVYS